MVRKQKLATFNVDPDLWEAFKAKAVESGGNATSEILRFVRQYVNGDLDSNLDADLESDLDQSIKSYIDKYLEEHLDKTVSSYLDNNLDKNLDSDIDEYIDSDIDCSELSAANGSQERIDINLDSNLYKKDDSDNLETEHNYIICRLEDKKVVEIWGNSQAWVKVEIALHPKVTAVRKYATVASVKTQLGKLRKKFPREDIRWNTLATVRKLFEDQ